MNDAAAAEKFRLATAAALLKLFAQANGRPAASLEELEEANAAARAAGYRLLADHTPEEEDG